MLIYSVKDKAAGQFQKVNLAINEVVAKREFLEVFKAFPYRGDLALFILGEYDYIRGTVIGYPEPFFVMDYPAEV
jgi:hypothetical protein